MASSQSHPLLNLPNQTAVVLQNRASCACPTAPLLPACAQGVELGGSRPGSMGGAPPSPAGGGFTGGVPLRAESWSLSSQFGHKGAVKAISEAYDQTLPKIPEPPGKVCTREGVGGRPTPWCGIVGLCWFGCWRLAGAACKMVVCW